MLLPTSRPTDLELQVLSSQQILSAPVVACSDEDTPDDCGDVIGFIDIRDVLLSFLSGKQAHNPGHYCCVQSLKAATSKLYMLNSSRVSTQMSACPK